jgi:hypothetical protein
LPSNRATPPALAQVTSQVQEQRGASRKYLRQLARELDVICRVPLSTLLMWEKLSLRQEMLHETSGSPFPGRRSNDIRLSTGITAERL